MASTSIEKKQVESLNLDSYAIYNTICMYDKPISNRVTSSFFNKSLDDVLLNLEDLYDVTSIQRLNLANNFINLYGTIKLIKFILEKLPNLEVLDLTNNDITNEQHPEFKELSKLITELLKQPKFKFLLLKGNKAFIDREKLIYNPNEELIDKIPLVYTDDICIWQVVSDSPLLK
jgi:hypothetical protein